jgi:hypothetical protein
MWLVYTPKGSIYRFQKDVEAHRFMLRYVEDEVLTCVSPEERSQMICDLMTAFKARCQLKEGWGIENLKAVFKEF